MCRARDALLGEREVMGEEKHLLEAWRLYQRAWEGRKQWAVAVYQVPSKQMNREDIPDEPRAYNRPLES